MATFILILIILVCVLLSLIVLVQNPKGGGLDSSFSSANQIGGVKRTADFLEKSTWTLTIVLFVLCLIYAGSDNEGQEAIRSQYMEQPLPSADQAPAQSEDAAEMPEAPADENPQP